MKKYSVVVIHCSSVHNDDSPEAVYLDGKIILYNVNGQVPRKDFVLAMKKISGIKQISVYLTTEPYDVFPDNLDDALKDRKFTIRESLI